MLAIGAVSERPEFRAFWHVIEIFLQISGICVMMSSKNGKATEQAKRHGKWQVSPGRIAHALNVWGTAGRRKKFLAVSARKSLKTLDSDKLIPLISFD